MQSRTNERGAALVPYALLIALVVGGLIGAVQTLGDSAGNLLSNTGDDIGHPRDYRDLEEAKQFGSLPPGVEEPNLSRAETYTNSPVLGEAGCLKLTETGSFTAVDCESGPTLLSAQAHNGKKLRISLADGRCLTDRGEGLAVTAQAGCKQHAIWTETLVEEGRVAYVNRASARCLTLQDGTLITTACSFEGSQQFRPTGGD